MRYARFPLFAAGAGLALIAWSVFADTRPVLIWNASPSVPVGLYAVGAHADLSVGDLVLVKPPEPLARLLEKRWILPDGAALLKPVAALPGQRICRNGDSVTVDGVTLAWTKPRDRMGRPLPVWQGCHRLDGSEVFLLSPDHPGSFDGRYFGPLTRDTIIGRAVPIWTRED